MKKTNGSAPLEWVKLYTEIDGDGDWLAKPAAHRYIFLHLLVLAGISRDKGKIYLDARQLASRMRVDPKTVNRALVGMTRAVVRTSRGLEIKNWQRYQQNREDRVEEKREEKKRREKRPTPLPLSRLPEDAEYWTILGKRYPLVHLERQLEMALAWRADHPERKYSSERRFFQNWAARADPEPQSQEIDWPLSEGRPG